MAAIAPILTTWPAPYSPNSFNPEPINFKFGTMGKNNKLHLLCEFEKNRPRGTWVSQW